MFIVLYLYTDTRQLAAGLIKLLPDQCASTATNIINLHKSDEDGDNWGDENQ
jgi:hypothetical protein